MNTKLNKALSHILWEEHKIGDIYLMDNKGNWKIAYYPIFECGKTGKEYDEPRALVEAPAIWEGKEGIDFREVPLRYLKKVLS